MPHLQGLYGVFALAIYDSESGKLILARDPYGIRPLYKASCNYTGLAFASEVKAFIPGYSNVRHVLPGTVEVYDVNSMCLVQTIEYHTVPWITNHSLTLPSAIDSVRSALLSAVEKRLLTDRPVAALLSGGLDSSLIASMVQRSLAQLGKPPLKTFSIGFKGSSDAEACKASRGLYR